MCGLFASSDVNMFFNLAQVNQPRGMQGWSVTILDENNSVTDYIESNKPTLPTTLPNGAYYIGHAVAPTTGEIHHHPALFTDNEGTHRLWHNGIMKASFVKHLQVLLAMDDKWDTRLLLTYLHHPYQFNWRDIHGSYTCIHLSATHIITVFRNSIAPLYYNGCTLSSTETSFLTKIQPNTVFQVNTSENIMTQLFTYTDNNTPYLLGE